MTNVTIHFTFERETRNAVRYSESDTKGNPTPYAYQNVGILYIKKRAFNGENFPHTLKVTIEPKGD